MQPMPLLIKPKFALVAATVLVSGALLVAIAVSLFRANTEPAADIIIDELIPLPERPAQRVIHAQKPQFAALSYYVAIVDNSALLSTASNNPCLNLSKQLSALSAQLQTHFMPSHAGLPIVIGLGAGAATTYAALAQADKHTFHAALGINFTPKLNAHRPLCDQALFTLDNTALAPVKRLASSFYMFQDKDLPGNASTRAFADKISNAKFTLATEADQTPVSEAIQILQWLDPRRPAPDRS
jgi:type IV secretory pathway VirJ component